MGLVTKQQILDAFEYAVKITDSNTLFAIHKIFELFPHFDSLQFGPEHTHLYITRDSVYTGNDEYNQPVYEELDQYQVYMIFDPYNPTVSNVSDSDIIAVVQDKIVNLVRGTRLIDFLSTIPTYILNQKIKEKEEELQLLKQQLQ